MKSLNNVREKRLLNYEELKQSAVALLGGAASELTSLTPLNLGLSNDNFEFRFANRRFLLKAYRTAMPQQALCVQQQLAESSSITTCPVAWHVEKRLALFEFWPGNVYQGQDWSRVMPLLVQVHQHAAEEQSSHQAWSLDIPSLLTNVILQEPLYNAFEVERVIQSLPSYPRFSAYCHNDLVRENILCNGSDIRLIDFEYAGWHDVYFDLAALAVSFKLTKRHAEAMLEHYHSLMKVAHSPMMDKLSDYRLAYLSLSVEWYEQRGYKQEADLLLSQLPDWSVG